jgi:hypothetical protein
VGSGRCPGRWKLAEKFVGELPWGSPLPKSVAACRVQIAAGTNNKSARADSNVSTCTGIPTKGTT